MFMDKTLHAEAESRNYVGLEKLMVICFLEISFCTDSILS